jgi:membrane-associated phospholipid phosphatase
MMMRQRIARLVSNTFNPFLVSFVIIVLLVLHTAKSPSGVFKWAAIALVFSVLPVFGFMVYQVRRKKLDSIFPEGQGQRNMIYLMSSLLAAVGCAVMWYLNAPRLLTVSFIAGLLAVLVFMLINIYWKISLHTAFISAAAAVLTLVFGVKVAWLFLLVPLVAWSRLELKMHTPAQVGAGAVLAAAIVSGVLWGFGVTV